MADLLARFKLVDEMSDKLGTMAEKGQSMTEQWERAGDAASAALEGIAGGVSTAVSSVDGIATSIDNLQDAMGQADYWTDAVGNYSKELLEATYSTEELVEMGMKSADALEEQNRMLELCERSASELGQSMEATAQIQQDLSAAMDEAAQTADRLADNEDVSAETKQALAKASTEAAEAMRELEKAQQEADEALEVYNQTMASGTSDLNQLEAAAERAGHAAEALAEANGRATEATEELSNASEQAAEEAEGAGNKGTDAIGAVAGALAAAGITAKVMEIAGAVYELSGSFSEAEKTIVGATGATGRELDELMSNSLDVYASSSAENLNEVAASMMNVKTATGLTGDALEEATDAALVLNNVLGYEVAESSRTAGALMKNFGVSAQEAYNLIAIGAQNGADKNGDLLDVLNEYSAQYSALGLSAEEFVSSLVDGAEAGVFSVDKVGDAVKEFNIRAKDGSDTTAEAFELLGMNADIMSEKFAAGGDTARTAFFEVVNALESMDDPMAKNAAAVGLFGTQYEDLEATVLPVLSGIEGGTLDMYDAVGTLAEGAQSMGDEWQAAGNSIKAAFGSAITPAVSAGSSALAGFVQGVGEFLQEHPAVTKAITAIGVGLGVVVAGFALYAAGSAVATAATALFGTTLSAAIWPITAIAAAIAAVTAAVLFLVDAFQEDLGEVEGLTATTREQYYELQDLNAEYEEACEKYGETSEEALRLKYQVDDLTASYEANKQTVEEFTAEVDALVQSHDDLISSYEESMTTLDQNAVGTMSLIQKLDDLASTTNRTAAQEEQMKAVIDQLNTDLPDLALSYDDVTSSTEKSIAAMKQAAEAQAEQERQAEQKQAYVDLLKEQANLEEEIAKAEENVRLEQERMDNMSGWDHFWTGGEWDDLEAYQEALDELNAAYEENQAALQGIEDDWAEVAQAAEDAAESPASYEEAVAVAYDNVRAKVEELCAAYDEAYQAALESFEGQFGLFDEAEADMDATVANAQAALDSQLAYWESYSANVETLKNTSAEDLGVTQENYEALMAYAQSGSEEAAGLAASMAEAINSGNTEAVAALAETVGQVQAAKETAAAAVADWQTDFTAQMNAIEQEMQDTINGMDLSEEASAAASSTISSYAEQIRAGKSGAVTAAREVASAVTSALSAANATIHVNVTSSGSVAGHAKGTTNAESVFLAGEQGPELVARPAAAYANGTTDSTDYFIAGENGPELIVGEQGSTVFPTQETDRLIAALNEKRQPLQVFANGGGSETSTGRQTAQEQVKRILLEIAGSGAIEVSGNGADRETVLQIMWENLKPILMSIIQSEIYEEGDMSYEY
nr:MAG TPA: minor tail protein [Caudoviricetes sp.]